MPVPGEVRVSKDILDFPLLVYLLVLSVLLVLSTYLSFSMVSPPAY